MATQWVEYLRSPSFHLQKSSSTMNATAGQYSLEELLSNSWDRLEELLSNSWDRKIADDIADELGSSSGEQRRNVPEMRRFLVVKGCRELLLMAQAARQGKTSIEALRSVAHA